VCSRPLRFLQSAPLGSRYLAMDDHEQRQNALASLAKFRALSTLEADPEAEEIAKELEEQRRSKARSKLIGAGKVRGTKFSEFSSNTL